MAFTKNTDDMNIIQKLDDEPNDRGGMTAAALKAKFDEAGITLQDFINDHVDELGAATAAANLGFATSSAVPATNIQAAIENVQSQVADATTGEIANAGITNAKLADGAAAGWENISNDVTLEVETEVDGTYIKTAQLGLYGFRFSRSLGIVAYYFNLTVNVTRSSTIIVQHPEYLCDNFNINSSVFSESTANPPALARIFTLSGNMEHIVNFYEPYSGTVVISGWYFCDGE